MAKVEIYSCKGIRYEEDAWEEVFEAVSRPRSSSFAQKATDELGKDPSLPLASFT